MKKQIIIEEKPYNIKAAIKEKIDEGWLYKGTVSQYTTAGFTYVVVVMEKDVNNGKSKKVNSKLI